MREETIKNSIRGVLLVCIIFIGLIHTGSSVHAVPDMRRWPCIDVVDQRGVGQTENEVQAGMNDRAEYDPESGRVTWNIGKDYKLVEGYTYYVTFKVENGTVIGQKSKLVPVEE